MIRKILLFTLTAYIALPAYAASEQYCFSSEQLTEMYQQLSEQSPDMQPAYNELFDTMLANNESGATNNAGCVTQENLAQICKNTWDTNTEPCETFLYEIMTPVAQKNPYTLEYSIELAKTDFSDIDAEAFNQAFNQAVARRRYKNIPSKLQNMGPVFLEQAHAKQLNPFISAAISLYESGRGTSDIALSKNNIAGLGGPGKWMRFSTVAASIEKQAETLKTNIDNGRTNLKTLACSGKYCATRTTPWYNAVSSVAKELYRFYNTIIKEKNN